MAEKLRIALIADIHYGENIGPKRSDRGCELLAQVVDEINRDPPDLVVDLGDRISGQGSVEEDLSKLRAVARELLRLTVPTVHLLGNHDVDLDLLRSEEILTGALDSHSHDLAGWHLVFWGAEAKSVRGSFSLSASDESWLHDDLSSSCAPTVIFSHIPWSGASMVGNFYFEQLFPSGGEYRNGAAARRICAGHAHVVAVVCGHVHWNSIRTVDGIHHLTVQSLTESFTTSPKPAEAWALLTLEGDSLTIDVRGRDPFQARLPIRVPRQRWIPTFEKREDESWATWNSRFQTAHGDDRDLDGDAAGG